MNELTKPTEKQINYITFLLSERIWTSQTIQKLISELPTHDAEHTDLRANYWKVILEKKIEKNLTRSMASDLIGFIGSGHHNKKIINIFRNYNLI